MRGDTEKSSKNQEVEDYTLTNLPGGTFLAPFSYQEFAERNYEGFFPGLFLRNVVTTMLREDKNRWSAALDKDTVPLWRSIFYVVVIVVVLILLYLLGSGVYAWLQPKLDPFQKAIVDGFLAVVFFAVTLISGVGKTFLNSFVLPKESYVEVNRDYIEANLDALVPGNGDLPPAFVQVLRQDTPSYSSRYKTQQCITEMEQREEKGLALGKNRKFPHHLEFLFSYPLFRPNSYSDYPCMDDQKVNISVDEVGEKWAWHMVGIWSLLPPAPELSGAWGVNEEGKTRINAYREFATASLAQHVFEAMSSYDFDTSRVPPSRLRRVINAYGISSGEDEILRFDSSKGDDFVAQMHHGDANDDLPAILEAMAQDLSHKS
jgi:hypothetical protein